MSSLWVSHRICEVGAFENSAVFSPYVAKGMRKKEPSGSLVDLVSTRVGQFAFAWVTVNGKWGYDLE